MSHSALLHLRLCLSSRSVEELLAHRATVSHEAVRRWCLQFGFVFVKQLQHRPPLPLGLLLL